MRCAGLGVYEQVSSSGTAVSLFVVWFRRNVGGSDLLERGAGVGALGGGLAVVGGFFENEESGCLALLGAGKGVGEGFSDDEIALIDGAGEGHHDFIAVGVALL